MDVEADFVLPRVSSVRTRRHSMSSSADVESASASSRRRSDPGSSGGAASSRTTTVKMRHQFLKRLVLGASLLLIVALIQRGFVEPTTQARRHADVLKEESFRRRFHGAASAEALVRETRETMAALGAAGVFTDAVGLLSDIDGVVVDGAKTFGRSSRLTLVTNVASR